MSTVQSCVLVREATQDVPGLHLHEGVYTMEVGPQFKSKTELRFLRLIGSDAMDMPTTSEAVIAWHMAMRVLGHEPGCEYGHGR
ncbi:hypothetical protein [Ktedonobacter robiniae]|uniref:purine-nucleoside phosphorylase n=1 Tax=Ktedonobacter robiniae TaxID=2778365 RepID=A0ABQ3UPF6_9CHLR|nr:hypothetical protein [Ktedonobacter robiniae]GHO54611.1 hypothetical protein KSB_30860 [Ktedonobacter robiniae]